MLMATASDKLLLLQPQRRRRNPSRRSLHQNLFVTRLRRNLTSQFKLIWIDRYSKLPSLLLRNQLTGSNFIVPCGKWRRK
jgi:hypothetical protein